MDYDTLVSTIKAYTENTFPNTPTSGGLTDTQQLDTFIKQAERRIYNSAQLLVTRKQGTISCTSGTSTVATPADWMSPYALALITPRELLVNTDLDDDTDWTASGGILPTISANAMHFSSAAVQQSFTQVLDGGSSPAGSYLVGMDITFGGSGHLLSVLLIGAASEFRGQASFTAAGTGSTAAITATGEVSSFRIRSSSTDATVANPSLLDMGSGSYTYLLNKESSFIRESFPSPLTQAAPQFYALQDDDTIVLGPTPDFGYALVADYYYYPESIVTATNTWLGDNFEMPLLYGSLLEAFTFMQAEEDVLKQVQARYDEAIALLKQYAEGKTREDQYRTAPVRYPVR